MIVELSANEKFKHCTVNRLPEQLKAAHTQSQTYDALLFI